MVIMMLQIVAIGGGLGLLAWAIFGRKQLMSYTGTVVRRGQEALFEWALPSEAKRLAPIFLQVADEQKVDAFLLAAIAMRESRAGTVLPASGLGADGTGHGIMQIDSGSHAQWLATHDWRDPYTNITKGAEVLREALNYFEARPKTPTVNVPVGSYANNHGVPAGTYPDPRPLSGLALWAAALAAYNTGPLNTLRAISAGRPPDTTTTGGAYGSNALNDAIALAATFNRGTV